MRVSKADGSQVLDLQRDALLAAGVKPSRLYQDHASGKKDDRPGLEACLKSLREADTLIVWKLDRLGRNLRHLVNTIHDLMERKIGFRVLTGQGANIDTTTASGRLVFGIFAALAEFERELIRERTIAGLASARARGRNGGRPYTMTPAKLRLAQAAMATNNQTLDDRLMIGHRFSKSAITSAPARAVGSVWGDARPTAGPDGRADGRRWRATRSEPRRRWRSDQTLAPGRRPHQS
jgi:DNA invertase Pin-like site-specific DNA recombinase